MIEGRKKQKNQGITLVALIITIIILIILAAVTINAVFGLNILDVAQKAAQDYTEGQYKEKEEFEKLNEMLKKGIVPSEGLPENTPDIDVGTLVAIPDKWKNKTQIYELKEDGAEVIKTSMNASVYAVSAGNGETIPVPFGFYYVGGNLSNGVIISDNEEDRYENGRDKTTWEYTTNLKGNQFVWIPCEASEYTKRDWGKQNANWETTVEMGEKVQVEKYGGFYVGRYEAGLASNILEFTEIQEHAGSNQIYNKAGIPQSKAGQIPWIFIDWNNSKVNAESMYNTDYVNSGLITGTQFDVMLKALIEKTDLTENDVINDSSNWGNYRNTQLKYKGRIATKYVSSNGWNQPKFGEVVEGTTSYYGSNNTKADLLTTGASAYTEEYHIYDVAGNVWELTEEVSTYQTNGQYRVCRGGADWNASGDNSACYRGGDCKIDYTSPSIGFRTVLYIK